MASAEGSSPSTTDNTPLIVAAAASGGAKGVVTARKAGGLTDMRLPVSPSKVSRTKALQNMAKAINLAFQPDFLPNELESAYKAARVTKGTVKILHRDYIGLGDGIFARLGKAARSFRLTLEGPDPTSPEGRALIEKHGGGTIRGLLNFMGRKLNLVQEYEDQVPTYVEQTLDRLEAAGMIQGWDRDEWEIVTEAIGLDVIIRPTSDKQPAAGETSGQMAAPDPAFLDAPSAPAPAALSPSATTRATGDESAVAAGSE